jgi:hypothetical protein
MNNKGYTLISRSKILGRDWLPIKRTSLRPSLIRSATLSPFLSSKAFVATVVPILMLNIYEVGIFSARGRSTLRTSESIRLIPSVGASW